MYRIWIGLEPKAVLGALLGAVSMIVLVIHVFAFKVVGYPTQTKTKYPQYFAPPPATAPVR